MIDSELLQKHSTREVTTTISGHTQNPGASDTDNPGHPGGDSFSQAIFNLANHTKYVPLKVVAAAVSGLLHVWSPSSRDGSQPGFQNTTSFVWDWITRRSTVPTSVPSTAAKSLTTTLPLTTTALPQMHISTPRQQQHPTGEHLGHGSSLTTLQPSSTKTGIFLNIFYFLFVPPQYIFN